MKLLLAMLATLALGTALAHPAALLAARTASCPDRPELPACCVVPCYVIPPYPRPVPLGRSSENHLHE